VTLAVAAIGRTSVAYALEIAGAEGVAVRGRVKTVLVGPEDKRAVPWPEDVRAALVAGGEVAPA
jgi:acyl-CoA thioesterase FadM